MQGFFFEKDMHEIMLWKFFGTTKTSCYGKSCYRESCQARDCLHILLCTPFCYQSNILFVLFKKEEGLKKYQGVKLNAFLQQVYGVVVLEAQHYHIAYQSCSLMMVPNIRLCTRIGSEYMFMYPIILHSMQISRNFFQKLVELNFCVLPWFQVIPGGRTHHYY